MLSGEHCKVVWTFQNSHQSSLIQRRQLLFTRKPTACLLGMEGHGRLRTGLPPLQKAGERDFPPSLKWINLLLDFRGWDSAHNSYILFFTEWLIRTRMWVKGLSDDIPQLYYCLFSCSLHLKEGRWLLLDWIQILHLITQAGACDFMWLKCPLPWSTCFLGYVAQCEINLLTLEFLSFFVFCFVFD